MTRAKELRQFWINFSELFNSGIPVLRSIGILSAYGMGHFQDALKQIVNSLADGSTFSEAMAGTDFFTPLEINLIRSAEINATLDLVVKEIIQNEKILTRSKQLDTFWETLRVLLFNNTPILQAIKIAASIFDSEPKIKKSIMKINDDISNGDTIASAMESIPLFSPFEVNIVDIGEETGNLEEAISRLIEK